ncbi:hypothetical protein CAPTEDRAFT_220854 [Capitella teleta]|uniref:Uncharacterized protein n=1 Tax=Capitella teleta TaxID=283909 RepID=R7V266_CAPTE|nr:hypothetical protein CAPTEDRAFT_220854 [Capitella teleta]|eukprot:ELU09781.1 hypothetical protein CAPTEDRAFT_220854 [Capitella teleta]
MGLSSRGCNVLAKLALLLGLCVALFVVKSLGGMSVFKRSFLGRGANPMYDDVNIDCLKKSSLNYGDITEKHQREEREVDISDWDADKICKLTEEESEYDRVVLDNILDSGAPDDGDLRVSYVTHFSYDRLDKFLAVVQHWPGYISAAVQIKADKVEEFVNNYCREPELAARDNIGIHLVIQKGIFYPYNHYRNIALDRAPTSHVFVTDIDLVPSDDLERRSLQHFKEQKVGEKQVLVVPSFEITKEHGYTVPRSKEDLLEIWDRGELQEFYINHQFSLSCSYGEVPLNMASILTKHIFYPYNHYRNIALDRAPTSHVFVTDIDLVPSDDLERRSLQHFKEQKVGEKQVLVVPSFEITKEHGYSVPRSKEDLLEIWDRGELQEFYATRYAPAYMPLNYTVWRTATEPYWVKYYDQFEPYVIAEKAKLQPYTNRFVGRFYNKATHLAELHCRGYEFVVAPDVFNVHIPHESIHEKAFDAYFRCLYRLYEAFKAHLEATYSLKMPPKAPLKPDGT